MIHYIQGECQHLENGKILDSKELICNSNSTSLWIQDCLSQFTPMTEDLKMNKGMNDQSHLLLGA